VSVSGIFLMRQTFVMLPRDVEDAARLDGAGEWTLFWRVALPPGETSGGRCGGARIHGPVAHFLWPLVVTRTARMESPRSRWTHFHTAYAANWPYQMAPRFCDVACTRGLSVGAAFLTQGVRFTGAQARL